MPSMSNLCLGLALFALAFSSAQGVVLENWFVPANQLNTSTTFFTNTVCKFRKLAYLSVSHSVERIESSSLSLCLHLCLHLSESVSASAFYCLPHARSLSVTHAHTHTRIRTHTHTRTPRTLTSLSLSLLKTLSSNSLVLFDKLPRVCVHSRQPCLFATKSDVSSWNP